jgi:hypothetical protein
MYIITSLNVYDGIFARSQLLPRGQVHLPGLPPEAIAAIRGTRPTRRSSASHSNNKVQAFNNNGAWEACMTIGGGGTERENEELQRGSDRKWARAAVANVDVAPLPACCAHCGCASGKPGARTHHECYGGVFALLRACCACLR